MLHSTENHRAEILKLLQQPFHFFNILVENVWLRKELKRRDAFLISPFLSIEAQDENGLDPL